MLISESEHTVFCKNVSVSLHRLCLLSTEFEKMNEQLFQENLAERTYHYCGIEVRPCLPQVKLQIKNCLICQESILTYQAKLF